MVQFVLKYKYSINDQHIHKNNKLFSVSNGLQILYHLPWLYGAGWSTWMNNKGNNLQN